MLGWRANGSVALPAMLLGAELVVGIVPGLAAAALDQPRPAAFGPASTAIVPGLDHRTSLAIRTEDDVDAGDAAWSPR